MKISKKCWDYLKVQRTRLVTQHNLDDNSSETEITIELHKMNSLDMQIIAPKLNNNVTSVVDIGCGMGLIDIGLYHYYHENDGITFYLVDKSEKPHENKVYRGFRENYCFYNSLPLAVENLKNNGVKDYNIIPIDVVLNPTALERLRGVDLVLSLLSCGWHYPLTHYIDTIYSMINDGSGLLIIDIRNDTNGEEILNKYFHTVRKVENPSEKAIGWRYICRGKRWQPL